MRAMNQTPKNPGDLQFDDAISAETYRPLAFRLAIPAERSAIEGLRRDPRIRMRDTLNDQLRDLIRTQTPARKFGESELKLLVKERLGETTAEDYGVWWYYPWSGCLVHALDEAEFIELRTNRNRYKITPQEQEKLSHKRIGVVGLSAGHAVALTMALERSCGELRLADFDCLDLSNLNRIRTGIHNLGLPKVWVTAREIAEIDPYLQVTCFPAGVTNSNCDFFLAHESSLDVVVEECDSIDIKVLLRHRARHHRIPVVMSTSDRGMIDVERFDLEPERAIFHGLIGNVSAEDLHGLSMEQKIPHVLHILGLDEVSSRLRASLLEVEQSISTWPQLGSAVSLGGAATADVVRRIVLGDAVRSGRYYTDLDTLIPGMDPKQPVPPEKPTPGLVLDENAGMLSVIRDFPAPTKPNVVPLEPDVVRRLVSDATLAPSGGNCQPWKWVCDGQQLYLFHDVSRSATAWDAKGFGGLVALGASLENLTLSAYSMGRHVEADLFPSGVRADFIARLRLKRHASDATLPVWRHELYSLVDVRRTNRKLGSRSPLPPDDLHALTEAVGSIPQANLHWLTDENELSECGALIGATDRLLILTEEWSRSLFAEIRWTPEEAATTRDGIALTSLELSSSDEAGFQLCRDRTALRLIADLGGGANLEKMSRKAVAGAAVVGLITMPQRTTKNYLWGGFAVQRLWLTAAERHLALHPMTALPYLLAQVETQKTGQVDSKTRETLWGIGSRFRKLFPVADSTAQLFLFRLSQAEETSHRSLRREVCDVLTAI